MRCPVPCGPDFQCQDCENQCLNPAQPFPPIASRLPCDCPNISNLTPGIPWFQAKAVTDPENACNQKCVPVDCCRMKWTCRLPERAKSYKPTLKYKPPIAPFEPETIYNQSYLPAPFSKRKPFTRNDNLCVGTGKFEDYTVHKLSYIPFCQVPDCFISPYPECVEIVQDEDEENARRRRRKKRKCRRAKSCPPIQGFPCPPCRIPCNGGNINCSPLPKCELPQKNNSNPFGGSGNYIPWYSIIRPCG